MNADAYFSKATLDPDYLNTVINNSFLFIVVRLQSSMLASKFTF